MGTEAAADSKAGNLFGKWAAQGTLRDDLRIPPAADLLGIRHVGRCLDAFRHQLCRQHLALLHRRTRSARASGDPSPETKTKDFTMRN